MRPGAPQPFLEALSIDTAIPNTVYTQQAAKPACQEDITVNFSQLLTPNTVYTQQAAKPACQEDITVHFSQLLLAQLPRTQFTHSKLPNPHARKTSPCIFRISCCTATPNTVYTQQQAAKPACQEDITGVLRLPHRPEPRASGDRAPTLSKGSEYCACHTERSRGPAATGRAATSSGGSEYCACHTERSRGPAATGRAATSSRRSEYCACQTERSRGPAATGRAATSSGGSEYCACHTERTRGPGAQPFLEALSTAPATQRGAAGQRRNL